MSAYAKTCNADVVIFESATLVHSVVNYSFINSDVYFEFDNEGELERPVFNSSEIIFSVIQRYTNFKEIRKAFYERMYTSDLDKSLSVFVKILIASSGEKSPLLKVGEPTFLSTFSMDSAVLRQSVDIFTSQMLPEITNMVEEVVKQYVRNEGR